MRTLTRGTGKTYWIVLTITLVLFTAAFLRRRGYCCGSGCRHCPYGRSPQGGDDRPEPAVGIELPDGE